MGQVNYKSDYAAFTATTHAAVDDMHRGDVVESSGKCLRPRLGISRALIGAFLLSITCHALGTLAISMAPTPAEPRALESDFIAMQPRVVHLDWDQYYGADDQGSAADLEADPTGPEPPAEPQTVAAATVTPKEDPAPQRTQEKTPAPELDTPEEPEAQPSPSLETITQKNDAKTKMPEADAKAPASNTSNHPYGHGTGEPGNATAGGHGTGTQENRGIARGPHRQKGSQGDGTGKDIGEMRRGHIAQLNRAIRSKNPCTRKLSHHGASGDVILGLTQTSDGRVNEVRVLRSSGEPMIDDAAKDFLRNQQSLPAPDASLTGDVWKIGLRFKCDA